MYIICFLTYKKEWREPNMDTKEKKTDLRILKTHKALCEAFLSMLEEKKFEDITVNELCEKAMVRRATFYKHFADKYEFFGFFVRQIQESFQTKEIETMLNENPSCYYIYLFKKGIEFMKEHEKIVSSVVNSSVCHTLLQILFDEIYRNVLLKLKEDAATFLHITTSPEVLASFYAGGIIQILRYWITSNPPIPEETIVKDVEQVLRAFALGQE